MKECDNCTRKIHISSNFILSISLLIMFDTLLLRPSLYCNTSLHITELHPATLHYTYRRFTSSHLHFTTLSFSFTHLHFLSFCFTSHHWTRHSTVLISKHTSKIMYSFTALKKLSSFHFISISIFFLFSSLSSLHFTSLVLKYKTGIINLSRAQCSLHLLSRCTL
jgi:hypothetical protein